MRPKCLVLLATHNAGPYLVDLLESVLAQSDVRVEVLISDDNSCDGTLDICKQYANDYDNVCVLSNDKIFKSASKNFFNLIASIDFDKHDYDCVAFCDQDDLWQSNKLSVAYGYLSTGSYEGYSCSTKTFHDSSTKSTVLAQSDKVTQLDYLFEGAGQGCTFVMTRKLMILFQQFLSESYSELSTLHYHDWAVYAYARSIDQKWYFDHNVYLQYRQHSANDTGAKQGIQAYIARISLVKSGWYIHQVRILASCLASAIPQNSNPSFICNNPYLSGKKQEAVRVLAWFRTLIKLVTAGRRKTSERFALGIFFILGWLTRSA